MSCTPTRPTAAQAENPCSPLHRLAGDLRSHRLPSPGSSSLVGREHPHRCLGCSAQAVAGSPPSRKNRSTCGAAPLNLHTEACWHQSAEALCLLSEGAWAPMFSPAMPRSPIPRPLSATLGWSHLPGTAALSQDHSCLSAAKISVTGRVGRRSTGTESSYSILKSGGRPPKSPRYFCSSR